MEIANALQWLPPKYRVQADEGLSTIMRQVIHLERKLVAITAAHAQVTAEIIASKDNDKGETNPALNTSISSGKHLTDASSMYQVLPFS